MRSGPSSCGCSFSRTAALHSFADAFGYALKDPRSPIMSEPLSVASCLLIPPRLARHFSPCQGLAAADDPKSNDPGAKPAAANPMRRSTT